jgi:hypothetical protein
MNNRLIALTLAATPLAAWAAGAAAPTLHPVTSTPPPVELRVSCQYQNWPTRHQVQRFTNADADTSARLRQQLLVQGRHVCWQGYTHVEVQFSSSQHAVAIAGR